METSSVVITDTFSVHCFDQYLTYNALRDLKQFIQFKKLAGYIWIINKESKVT